LTGFIEFSLEIWKVGLPEVPIDDRFFFLSLLGELSMLERVWSRRGEALEPLKADIGGLIEDILLGRLLFSLDLHWID